MSNGDIRKSEDSKIELVTQEDLLKLVTENSTDVVCLFDENQRLVYISPVIEKMTGHRLEEIKERGFHDYIHPEDREYVKETIKKSLAAREAFSRYKYRHVRSDGSAFWLEVNAHRNYNDQGQNIRTIANLRDVDEQVQTQLKLRENERFLSETQRLASLGSWEYDLEHDNIKFSHEITRLFGFESSPNQGIKDIIDRVVDEDRELVQRKFDELLTQGNGFNIDFTIHLGSNRKRSLNGIGYAERGATGKVLKVKGAIIDITRRKENEIELRRLKEQAEKAAKAKQQFLSNVSHELRTPLNAVLGITDLLEAENPREDQKEKINVLKYSAENLLHLINDVLDYSALEERKLTLDIKDLNLEEFLTNVTHLFTEKANDKGIELNLEADNIPETIKTDQFRLNQILVNLLGNAIKFTDKGSVNLKAELKEDKGDKQIIRFSVSDTGIGLSPSEINAVFDRFYQSSYSISKKTEGTGLGLSITKGLLQLMGSEIHVDSAPGKGSVFWFDLENIKDENNRVNEQVNEYQKEPKKLSDLKVLIAEDNSINQFVVKKMLARWDIEPTLVENGKEALDLILADSLNRFDLILLDLQMPVMDGEEAARKMRLSGVNTPIVAITAAVLPDQRKSALESGMNDFLGKPFKSQELLAVFEKYCD